MCIIDGMFLKPDIPITFDEIAKLILPENILFLWLGGPYSLAYVRGGPVEMP